MGLSKSAKLNAILIELRAILTAQEASAFFVAVSGGLDSMLLTALLLEIGLPIELVHVNYGLRGEESDRDEQFLVNFCREKNLKFHCKKVNLGAILSAEKKNLQATARNIRYNFFKELQSAHTGSVILTAHHKNDQIETFWLQLARGAGQKGLAGMSLSQQRLMRPLLFYSREKLKEIALELKVEYREDSSNSSLKYRRNYWRHELLPFLKAAQPSIDQNVSLIQQYFQQEIKEQSGELSILINDFKINKSINLIKLSKLTAYQVIELLKNIGIPTFVIRRIGELFRAENGKFLTWQDMKSKQQFFLVKQRLELQFFNNEIQEWTFQMSTKITENQQGFLIDASAICGAPFWRLIAPDDKMKIKGMQGSKKIAQILKEAGVPSPIRKLQMVLCDQEKVLALPGLQVNAQILANPSTQNKAVLCFAKKP